LGDNRALPGLQAAQHDIDEKVRRAADRAFDMIGEGQAREAAEPIRVAPVQAPISPSTRWSAGLQIGLLLLAVAAAGMIIVSLISVAKWNRSLGPELIPLATYEGAAGIEALPPPAGQSVCGGPPVMMLLLVGSDAQSSDYAAGFAAYQAMLKPAVAKRQKDAAAMARYFIPSKRARPWLRRLVIKLMFSPPVLPLVFRRFGARSVLEGYT